MSWDDYFTLSRSFSDTHSVDGVASPCSSLHSTQCSYEETPCVKVFLYNDDPMDIPIEPDLTVVEVLVMALDYGQEMDLIDHRLNDEHFVFFTFTATLGKQLLMMRLWSKTFLLKMASPSSFWMRSLGTTFL